MLVSQQLVRSGEGQACFRGPKHDLARDTWRRIGRENMAPWLGGNRSALDEDYQAGRAARVPPGTRTDNSSKTATFVLIVSKTRFRVFRHKPLGTNDIR